MGEKGPPVFKLHVNWASDGRVSFDIQLRTNMNWVTISDVTAGDGTDIVINDGTDSDFGPAGSEFTKVPRSPAIDKFMAEHG